MVSLLEDWRALAERLRQANSVALFLDFDGTLTDLQDDAGAVVLRNAVRLTLMRLARHPGVRVSIISGRRLSDLQARVGAPGVTYLGVHGSDTGHSELPAYVIGTLADARHELASRLNGSLNGSSGRVHIRVHIEDKDISFAVHYRRADEAEASRARVILDQVLEPYTGILRIVPGDRVWEVLPREIRGKGEAARRLWHLWSVGAVPIYIGNDGTDEGAFGALASGITARVGPARHTKARYFLRNPAEVARFLERLEQETPWRESA